MLSNLRDPLHFLFCTVSGKGEKRSNVLETTMMAIVSNDAEFGYPLKFLTACYRQPDLTLGVF